MTVPVNAGLTFVKPIAYVNFKTKQRAISAYLEAK